MRKLAALLLLPLSTLSVAPAWAAADRSAFFASFAEQEARLATVAYRLSTANANWCPKIEQQPGWLLSDLRRFQASDQKAATATYGAGDAPFIAAVAPGSPAERANLRRGVRIAAIDGQALAPSGDAPTIRVDTAIVALSARDAGAAWTMTDTEGRQYRVPSSPGCASAFRIELGGAQAAANGLLVRMTHDLAQSIDDEEELAAVIAHELSHNILRHRDRLGSDRSAARVQRSELEADRLAVWLMAGAGYDPAAAIRFWNRHKRPLIRAATHPPRSERIVAIESEIAAMQAAKIADPAARPVWIANPPPLE